MSCDIRRVKFVIHINPVSVTKKRIWQTTEWGIWMLAVSVCLNYVDRGSLSIAAPQVAKELALDPAQMGILFSAFFFSYAILQIPSGWLVDRFDVKKVLGVGFALWSIATGLHGLANSFAVLLGFRLLLGIGESVAYPAYSRIIATRFPPEKRGFPNALIDAFSKAGPALGTLLGGLLVATYGWRSLFLLAGIGGMLWLIPWMMWRSDEKVDVDAAPAGSVGFVDILKRPEVWGTFCGLFAINYTWYFLISWFPSYLVSERGFSQEKMAVIGSLPFWVLGASSLFTGWLSDRLIGAGKSTTLVRKGFVVGGLVASAILLPFAAIPNVTIALALLMVMAVAFGFATSNNWAVTQTLAGHEASGKWTGLQNCVGNFGGVVSPAVTGFIVKETQSFFLAFMVSAAVLAAGAILYFMLIRRVAPVPWPVSLRPVAVTAREVD